MFRTIEDFGDIRGKRVLLRADFNVAIQGGRVTEPFRIDSTKKTIDALVAQGAKVGIVSHIENDEGATLEPVASYLQQSIPLSFVPDVPTLTAELLTAKEGEVFLMENIRQYSEEKGNDLAFARELSAAFDLYVNDAFAVSHREHASIVGVPRFLPAAAGSLIMHEVEELSKAFHAPQPFVLVLGGAKLQTKLPLISKFLSAATSIFVVGALANDLLKVRGNNVGSSKVSDTVPDIGLITDSKRVIAPVDVLLADGTMKAIGSLEDHDVIMDAGPQTVAHIERALSAAAFVVWNGPLGVFEKGFTESTKRVALAIAASKAYSIIGGGDTIAAVEPYHVLERFSFVSTGGGAMLDYLAHGTLPGLVPLMIKAA